MVAIFAAALVACVALVVDIGIWYVGDRDLESATEAAALSAAIEPGNASVRAADYLERNGYPASVLQSIQVGRYCADNSLGSAARFYPAGGGDPCPGNGVNNAVRLTTSQESRRYFSRIFGDSSPIPTLTATATAARIDEAGIAATTRILDGAVANLVLSVLAGENVALTTAQYQGLLASNIDAGLFFDALAERVGESGTYAQLVGRTVPLSDILAASETAMGNSSDVTAIGALQALSAQIGGSVSVPLAGLFELGVWEKMPVGGANRQTGLRAGLNAYQLIAYALQTGSRSLTLTLTGASVGVPGILEVRIMGTAAGPLARPRFGFGPAGETVVSTSALRILLSVKFANFGNLLDGLGLSLVNQLVVAPLKPLLNALAVDVPLLIDIAAGQASVASIACGQEAATDTVVNVAAQSGLLHAYLGALPADAMATPLRPIAASEIGQVTLIDLLGLLRVYIKAVAGPVTGGSDMLEFRQVAGGDGVIGHPPAAGQPARLANGSQIGPLLTSLGGNLQVDACLIGILCGGQLAANVIASLATPIAALGVDPLLDNILAALGIQPGYADVWVTGARCGVPVLV